MYIHIYILYICIRAKGAIIQKLCGCGTHFIVKNAGKKPDTSFYSITDFKPKVDETKAKATGKNY